MIPTNLTTPAQGMMKIADKIIKNECEKRGHVARKRGNI